MKTLPILLTLAVACSPAVLMSAPGATQLSLSLAADAAAKRDELYRAGQRDIDAGHWTAAIDKFGQVAKKGGSDADGALYWKAYAEHKAGRGGQALSTLRQLAGAYPKSAWIKDAKALEVEVRGQAGNGSSPQANTPGDDEELKLYALNGLLASQPDRAVPMLQKFLQGNHSQRLKEQALFVLSQSGAPDARTMLQAVARGTAHADLQRKAIEYLGIAGDDSNLRALDDIYRTTSQADIRQSVLSAFLVANQKGRVLAVAKDGKDPLQGQAIGLLGSMGAKQELRQLYQADASPKARMKVLEAMGIAGDVETLIDAARGDQDPGVRNKAIQGLGIGGGAKGGEALRSLYSSSSDPSIRHAVIEALFIQANAHALIEIFGTEKDREMRKSIVQYLSLMGSDEATQFLEKIYSN